MKFIQRQNDTAVKNRFIQNIIAHVYCCLCGRRHFLMQYLKIKTAGRIYFSFLISNINCKPGWSKSYQIGFEMQRIVLLKLYLKCFCIAPQTWLESSEKKQIHTPLFFSFLFLIYCSFALTGVGRKGDWKRQHVDRVLLLDSHLKQSKSPDSQIPLHPFWLIYFSLVTNKNP